MIEPPLQLTAFEYRKIMAGGITSPLLMVAQDGDGNSHRVVVKLRRPLHPSGTHGATSLATELICAALGRTVGIRVPDYAVVTIPPQLPPAIPQDEIREVLAANVGPNFGSILLEGMATWSPRKDTGSEALLSALEDVLSFDNTVVNGDRKRDKPNLLWRGDQLYAIDHSLALPVCYWTDEQRDGFVVMPDAQIKKHCTASALMAKARSYSELFERWSAIVSDEALSALSAMVPSEWEEHPGHVESIFHFLRSRSGKRSAMTTELRRILR